MGYYTNVNMYFIDVEENSSVDAKVVEEIRDTIYKKFKESGYTWDNTELIFDQVKWYSIEEDIQDISKEYPDILFCVEGRGEEREDMWELECIDGQMRMRNIELKWSDWRKINDG